MAKRGQKAQTLALETMTEGERAYAIECYCTAACYVEGLRGADDIRRRALVRARMLLGLPTENESKDPDAKVLAMRRSP
jgi:hypothetical protein